MGQKTIVYRIRQDGVVEERIEGCTGDACEDITSNIEKKLGDVQYRQHTPSYYQKVTTEENVTLQHHQDQN